MGVVALGSPVQSRLMRRVELNYQVAVLLEHSAGRPLVSVLARSQELATFGLGVGLFSEMMLECDQIIWREVYCPQISQTSLQRKSAVDDSAFELQLVSLEFLQQILRAPVVEIDFEASGCGQRVSDREDFHRGRNQLEYRHWELNFPYALIDVFVLLREVVLIEAVARASGLECGQAGFTAERDVAGLGGGLGSGVGEQAEGLREVGACGFGDFEACVVAEPGALLLDCVVGKEPLVRVHHIRISLGRLSWM